MIDFRHETFLTLCNIKSYTKTAQALHLTQPAVSQHIKYLEKLYNGKLFTYNGKDLKLTPKGEKLFEYTKKISADTCKIKELIDDNQDKIISFGSTLSIGEFVMPNIISNVMKDNANIHFNMYVENTKNLLDKLESGELSFALIEGYFDKSKYSSIAFEIEPFVGICSPNSKYAANVYKIEDVLDSRLIVREKGSGTRAILETALLNKNLTVNSFKNILEIGNLNAIKEVIKSDYGISFMYEVVARKEIEKHTLSVINFENFKLNHEFSFVYLKNCIQENDCLYWADIFKSMYNKNKEGA